MINICSLSLSLSLPVIPEERWEEMMRRHTWNAVDLRDTRYHQIVHMVSAANGAEAFYSTEVSIGWWVRPSTPPLTLICIIISFTSSFS